MIFFFFSLFSIPDEGYCSNVPDEGYCSNVPDEGYCSNVPDEGYCRNPLCALKLIFTFVSYSRVNCFRLEIKGLLHQKKNKKKQQKGLLHQYHGMNNTRAIVLVNCMIFVMGSSQTNIYVYLLMVINVCIYINLMKSGLSVHVPIIIPCAQCIYKAPYDWSKG